MSCEFEENSNKIETDTVEKKSAVQGMVSNLPFYMEHSGEHGCGGIAFYLKRKLVDGDPLINEDVVWPNGEPAEAHQPLICPQCGGQIELQTEYIKSC